LGGGREGGKGWSRRRHEGGGWVGVGAGVLGGEAAGDLLEHGVDGAVTA